MRLVRILCYTNQTRMGNAMTFLRLSGLLPWAVFLAPCDLGVELVALEVDHIKHIFRNCCCNLRVHEIVEMSNGTIALNCQRLALLRMVAKFVTTSCIDCIEYITKILKIMLCVCVCDVVAVLYRIPNFILIVA